MIILSSVSFVSILTSCGNEEKEVKQESSIEQEMEVEVDYASIDSKISSYQLEEAIEMINGLDDLEESDEHKLGYYSKLLNRILEIEGQLAESDRVSFIQQTIDFIDGNFESTVLLTDYNSQIYSGSAFIKGKLGLLMEPQKLVLSCSYDDEYYYHVFTEINLDIDGKKVVLAKGSPANGFKENGKLKTRPFDFELTESQVKSIIESNEAKLMFTTAQTSNDRAYLNGTVWDVKGGSPIEYNDVSTFKERKAQILEEGEIKVFEIPVKQQFKNRLKQLFEIQQILIKNKVKSIED